MKKSKITITVFNYDEPLVEVSKEQIKKFGDYFDKQGRNIKFQ